MIIQTLALLVDAYRELNARKMFWITLILSALAMGGFAVLGIKADHLSILGFDLPPTPGMPAEVLYKVLFQSLIVGFWLTWAATILALVSTSSIFPDLITGGSVDLYLSKPISRLRLFLTKYITGLLFVLLQVIVFAVVGFFVLRLRGGFWFPGIFWSIPLIVCFFSYLYGVSVLVGILTRSTLAAILITILLWGVCWAIGLAEMGVLAVKTDFQNRVTVNEQQVQNLDDLIRSLEHRPNGATNPARGVTDDYIASRERHKIEAANARESLRKADRWYRVLYRVKTCVPKTTETIGILERKLITDTELHKLNEAQQSQPNSHRQRDLENDPSMKIRQRSAWWIVGTSLAFEAVVVSLAAFIFCRRDY